MARRYRVRDDFTSWVAKYETDEDTGKDKLQLENVCGFRVAGISRVTIASPTSTMTGDKDTSPTTVFAVSAQVPRYGHRLLRRVVQADGGTVAGAHRLAEQDAVEVVVGDAKRLLPAVVEQRAAMGLEAARHVDAGTPAMRLVAERGHPPLAESGRIGAEGPAPIDQSGHALNIGGPKEQNKNILQF